MGSLRLARRHVGVSDFARLAAHRARR